MIEPGTGPGQFLPDDLVLRRVPIWQVVDTDHGKRASGQAFDNDGDDEPMSVYLDPLLPPNGLVRAQILDDHLPGEFFVTAVRVGVLDGEDQSTQADPIHPPRHICDPAHGCVIGDKPTKRRSRIARTSRWVPGLEPPEGGQMLEE